jgi:hypothetical protein
MKTKLFVTFLSILCVLAIAASGQPPVPPSSFYGTAAGVRIGATVNVYVGIQLAASTKVFSAAGVGAVYTVKVPMDNVPDGTLAVFKIGGKIFGKAALHSGANVELDLKLTKTR